MKKTRFTAWLVCIVLVALTLSPALSATSYPYDTVSIDSVKLRKTASTSAVVLANISAGDSITVLGTSGKFYKVTYAGMTGYAMKSYVDGLASAESTAPASTAAPAEAIDSYPYDTTTADRVKLRKTASETANVLMVIPKDEIVTVYDVTSNGFAKVKYSGKTGYLMT
ncbi:MAG: SH3 domain-containing protein, partial [Eubacteriales bacterium]|nr:SH3 domain-containing protein [Eubacteriales bacterium]